MTRVYKEVAAAKLTIKQKPIYLTQLWRYMRGWRTTRGVLGLLSNSGTCP
jgi:hypothetical protein